jgi:1-acyl-sn-glycerol-3-phosphate acyltransferase
MKWLCKLYLKAIGWKTGSILDPSIKKCVLVAAPHTSNWDYPIALATLYANGTKVRFLGKDSLFKFPIGILMRATGGMPVDRSKHNNLVDALVNIFKQHEELVLMIAVEGTRSFVKEWKSGFYYTAMGANVPIVMGYLDYKNKVAGFGDLFYPTGEYQKDLIAIQNFYRQFTAKYPDKSSLNQ